VTAQCSALLHRWRVAERLRAVEHLIDTGQAEGPIAEEERDNLRARLSDPHGLRVEPEDIGAEKDASCSFGQDAGAGGSGYGLQDPADPHARAHPPRPSARMQEPTAARTAHEANGQFARRTQRRRRPII